MLMPETPEERSLELQRREAIQHMGWAAELGAAIDSIQRDIFNANQRKDISPRDKSMHEMQLTYCIGALRKRRNELAEIGVDLWKQVGT